MIEIQKPLSIKQSLTGLHAVKIHQSAGKSILCHTLFVIEGLDEYILNSYKITVKQK